MKIIDGALRAKLEAAQVAMNEIHSGREPTPEQLAAAPLLDAWAASEMGGSRVCGFVEGHPTIADGPATTSAVIFYADDRSWCRTISRYYRLGRPLADLLTEKFNDDRN